MILRFEFRLRTYYHLLVHAIFKSILFIAAGVIIHSLKNTQDIRLLGNLNEVVPFIMIRLLISNIALRDLPFISGFCRKDLIIEVIYIKEN
ncbi:NU5M oxidoreductase, partial [Acromyrmex charruanus]